MRLALALAAVVAFAAAPSAQSLVDAAPADAPAVEALALDLTVAPAPELAPAVDLSDWVAPSTVTAPAADVQDDQAKRGPSPVVYYGSMAVAAVTLGAFATLFF